jgi:hypothetical protein
VIGNTAIEPKRPRGVGAFPAAGSTPAGKKNRGAS